MKIVKLSDMIRSRDRLSFSFNMVGLVTATYEEGFSVTFDNNKTEFFGYMENDWEFVSEERQPDPYTGPARPPKPDMYPDMSDMFTEGTPPTPSEAPEYVYKGVKSHDLVLTIPEGTKRLEGEFEGYKVILEKL